MKILALLSSPLGEKSKTRSLVSAILEAAREEGSDTEEIDVAHMNIQYCRGCGVCWSEGKCALKDDLPIVLDKISHADGLIFSSPVYVTNMTAQLKTLFDRMTGPMHCQILDKKYTCSVSVSGSFDHDTVIAMISGFIKQCGGIVVGEVGAAAGINSQALEGAKIIAVNIGKDLVQAIKQKRKYPEQEKNLSEFRKNYASVIKNLKNYWKHDYQYWINKGWITE